MKSKKIVAGILAAAITVSSIAPEAFAEINDSDCYMVDVADLIDDSIDISDVYGAIIKFTDESAEVLSKGANGGFVFNTESYGWNQLSWCNGCDEDEVHDIIWDSETNSLTRLDASPICTKEDLTDGYAQIALTQWSGGNISVLSISLLDKDGNEFTVKDMPDNPAPGDSSGEVPEPGEDESDYTYSVLDDGTIEITGYYGRGGNVVIPAEIDGKSVTRIGDNVFENNATLINVTIPDGVTSIGSYAFNGCTALTSVEIPDSVRDIDPFAFLDCTSLATVTIPDGVAYISQRAFLNCTSLKAVSIPASVTNIDDYAFGYYEYYEDTDTWENKKVDGFTLEYVKNTAGHLYAAKNGFTDEAYLVTEELEDGTLAIIKYGGSDKVYTIPSEIDGKSVTRIGESAFYDCSNLTSVTLPDGVTSIDIQAFEFCENLTNVTLPDSLISIGNCAFNCCYRLTSITIPHSVTSIGEDVFSQCSSLKFIDVASENSNYISVNGVLFNKDKTELKCYPASKTGDNYVIPDSVTSIGASAFSSCDDLTSIAIPDSVIYIGSYAFYNCTSLKTVAIPASVEYIEFEAFYNCTSLKEVTIPASVKFISDEAFGYCYDKKVDGFKINYVNNTWGHWYATKNGFSDEACLVTNELDDGTLEIDRYAGNSATYEIPAEIGGKKVTGIKSNAFSGCTEMTSVTIPDSVTYIDYSAFYNCTLLKEVTIPASVNFINDIAFGYYSDDNFDTRKIDNFKIYCYSGTAGEQYAKDNDFEYELLECKEHKFGDWTISKAASCTEDGEKVRICSVCNETETETIPATGHTEVIDEAVAATCTETGLTEGIHCSVCDAIIKAQEVIPATGHKEVVDKAVAATCTKTGLTEGKHCSVCNAVIKAQEVVPAHGHTEVIDKAVAATCTKTGLTEGIHCSVCDAIIKAQEVVPAKGHKYVDTVVKPTYTTKGYTLHKCSVCGTSYKDTYTAKLTLAKVTGVKLGGRAADALRINWIKNTSADGYIVEMYQGGKWVRVAKITNNSTTTFRKAGLKASTVYKFRVRAYKMSGKTALYGNYSATVAARTNPSVIKGAKLTGRAADALRINWAKNASADGYIVEMYKGGKWVRAAKITNNSTTTFRKAGLKAGTVYKFRVKAYKMSGKTAVYGAYSSTVAARTNPSVIKGAKLTGRAADALRINWTKNTTADGYIVEMYKGGKWVRAAKITKNSTTTYRASGLKASTVYKFRVRAYKMSGKTALYGNYSATVTARTNPSIVKGVKIGGKAKDALRVNWAKNASAQGYIVEMYKGGKWVRVAKITNGNTTTFRKAGLAKNTAYKFRVCAYYMSGKTALYGNYGSVSGKTAAK